MAVVHAGNHYGSKGILSWEDFVIDERFLFDQEVIEKYPANTDYKDIEPNEIDQKYYADLGDKSLSVCFCPIYFEKIDHQIEEEGIHWEILYTVSCSNKDFI